MSDGGPRLALGLAATFVALVVSVAAARAESQALLVGVSAYPGLPESLRLQGPRNDVQRMRQILAQRGFSPARIRVLADGVADAGAPTRGEILRALDRLAEESRAGDTVFIQFAGHGSRQPASGAEGLEPIFLPLDVGRWDGKERRVANAIGAAELRERVDRIGARGAFVWAVFDACHSAAFVRGTDEGSALRDRHVDPAALGIDAQELDAAEAVAARTRGGGAGALDRPRAGAAAPGHGGTVFFYAAQPDELTPELRLPVGDPKRQPYGLFSFTIGRALERAQPMTYRQLAQYVLAEYGAIVEARATPLFSGNALDEPVLGQRSPPLRQWPLELAGAGPAVGAGRLSGIAPGAIFALLPGPLATDRERLGYLQATEVDATRAALVPVAHAERPPPRAADLAPGRMLRLMESPPEFGLRVAVDLGDCPADCPLREALRRLRAQGAEGVDLQWVERSAGPDVLLRHERGRALYLPPTHQGGDAAAPGLALVADGRPLAPAELQRQLGRDLHAIGRTRNLLALAARFAAEGRTNGLVATLRRASAPASDAARPDRALAVRDGDTLALEVENTGPSALDLTVLYADAEFGIGALFPSRLGESNRIEPGQRRTIDGIQIHAPPSGVEHMLLIAATAQSGAERADFSFLQQPALTRQRGAAGEEFQLFADAAFADYRQRGAARPASAAGRAAMQVLTLDVAPAAAAGAGSRPSN